MKTKFSPARKPLRAKRQDATRRELKAGPLSVVLDGGELRAIRFHGVEVLRGISYLTRDENWGTCAAVIRDLSVRKRRNDFDVTYAARSKNGGATLDYRAAISATPDRLEFSVTAKPDKDFLTNRTGFVVLHPINGVAGKSLMVTHTDGGIEAAHFPELISPGQPFFDIRALEHVPAPGVTAHVLMEGNKFEMEDQRNWTDASYKTYVCSLLDPWPYVMKAGQSFDQKITLTVKGKPRAGKASARNPEIRFGKASARMPEIGIAISAHDAAQTLRHAAKLKQLAPQFLTCLAEKDLGALETYAAIALEAGLPVTLEVVLPANGPADGEMRAVAEAARRAGLSPRAVVVTQTHDLKSFQPTAKRPWGPTYEEMAAAARKHFPGTILGGGMMSFFTELNRKRPPRGVFDFITHSLCPIVHDASDEAVMQTLECLPHVFASGKAMIGDAPYHIGPTTIAARMNPYGKDVVGNPRNQRVCLAPNDPRQTTDFAATWNLGLLAECAKAGITAVTLSSLCGPRGLLDAKGKPAPLYGLLAGLLPYSAEKVAILQGTNPDIVGMRAGTARGGTVWIGNISGKPSTAILGGKSYRLGPYATRTIALP